jgi:hypothetical protein
MTTPHPTLRPLALRVAKALREKGRTTDAVELLSAWAATGPNDAEGQALLAEALRLEPGSPIAKLAFERMEGIAGDYAALDAALARWSAEELGRADSEAARPVFQRAQVGFNNNLNYRGRPYHVQTEDSGLAKPHVVTHLFSDGGRIIKSHKRSYVAEVERPDVAAYVRSLMKAQHMEMVALLREGKLDAIIEGAQPGGLEVLEHPPVVNVGQVGGRQQGDKPKTAPAIPRPTAKEKEPVRVTLHVERSLSGGPERYDPRGDIVVLGRKGQVPLEGERFCHPQEAAISYEGGKLFLEDLEDGNGVFLRIRSRVEIAPGAEFVIGDQLLRLEKNPEVDDAPGEGPTYFLSSPKGPSGFRVVQVVEGGGTCACARARENLLQVGSLQEFANDLVVRGDPLVAKYHCVIEEQAETYVLTDLGLAGGTTTGVFVRVMGRQELKDGDELLVGRTRLRLEVPAAG